jgi:hypothetical protein
VTNLELPDFLRASQRLLTPSPTFSTGGYELSAEDVAPLGLDFILVWGLQRYRTYGAGGGSFQFAQIRGIRVKTFAFHAFFCG